MVFLPHTNTVILLEPYCGTITEPGLPVVISTFKWSFNAANYERLYTASQLDAKWNDHGSFQRSIVKWLSIKRQH